MENLNLVKQNSEHKVTKYELMALGCKKYACQKTNVNTKSRCTAVYVCTVLAMGVAVLTAAVLLAGPALLAMSDSPPPPASCAVVCYYSPGLLRPAVLPPRLCTHINLAFARVRHKQVWLDISQFETLTELVQLKKLNPDLKILISVGGAGGDNGFSEMVVDHASRKTFIRSIKSILHNYNVDGIDLDWEFPAVHSTSDSVGINIQNRERQHFSQLLREIRAEYIREKRDYLLTVAVAAPQVIVDASYDVDQLNQYVDYVNIMTYDYHTFTKFTPFTGLNAPLQARPQEQLYLATLNINYTVHMYLDKGLDKGKIVVGIPTYGRTFTLVNANNPGVGSPSRGVGSLGDQGFINYPDICSYVSKYGKEVQIVEDKYAKVPYLYRNLEWVSYDSPWSVMEKAQYIRAMGLRGAMVYSLNADDYNGQCDGIFGSKNQFPLVHSINQVLQNSVQS